MSEGKKGFQQQQQKKEVRFSGRYKIKFLTIKTLLSDKGLLQSQLTQ